MCCIVCHGPADLTCQTAIVKSRWEDASEDKLGVFLQSSNSQYEIMYQMV